MFKKLFLTLVLLAGCIGVSTAAVIPVDSYTISRDKLPEEAREMLDQHFPKAKVSMIKVDRRFLKSTQYNVKLTDGTKILFNSKGRWKTVERTKKSVPEALLHATVRKHIARNYSGEQVMKLTKCLSGYTVTLSGGKNLKYDLLGIFKGEITAMEAEAEEAADEAEAEE